MTARRRVIALAALLAALLAPATAGAAVYKCTDAQGKVGYQSLPCKDGSGDKVELKQPSVIAALSPLDRDWVNRTRPGFNSSCTQGLAVANAGNAGARLNPEQIRQICECTTRHYFEDTPIATLRGYDETRNQAAMQNIVTPITQRCGEEVLYPAPQQQHGSGIDEESILNDLR